MAQHDIVIRGGEIVDGTGGDIYIADVAIDSGRIRAIGVIDGPGAEEIDARGCIVTPGFVDVHTRYDGQVTWEMPTSNRSAGTQTTAPRTVIFLCEDGSGRCCASDE